MLDGLSHYIDQRGREGGLRESDLGEIEQYLTGEAKPSHRLYQFVGELDREQAQHILKTIHDYKSIGMSWYQILELLYMVNHVPT